MAIVRVIVVVVTGRIENIRIVSVVVVTGTQPTTPVN